jgi:hypothetical protein
MLFAAIEDEQKALAGLAPPLVLDLYLLFGMGLVVLLAGALFWPSRHRPNQRLPYLAVLVICLGAVVVPASYGSFCNWWASLSAVQQADILTVIHFGITLAVVGLQFLFLLGGVLNWAWVRNFWLRLFHLLTIVIVAGQGVNAVVCPFTQWEFELRDRDLANLEGSWPLAAWCNRRQYTRGEDPEALARIFAVGYVVFGLIVVASWFLVRPTVPGSDTEEEPSKPAVENGANSATTNGQQTAAEAELPKAPNSRVFPH